MFTKIMLELGQQIKQNIILSSKSILFENTPKIKTKRSFLNFNQHQNSGAGLQYFYF